MLVESQNQQPSVNVFPNGGNGGFGGFGDSFSGGGIFFWLILFFFMMMFMGWGGNWGNNGGNNNGGFAYMPYPMFGVAQAEGNYVRQGFDQAAIINGINGVQGTLQTGFSNAEVSRCNQQANLLATLNNNQNATNAGLQALNMGLQNCCCENRAAVADLKYTVATEACADRAAVGDALQAVTAQGVANTNALMNTINGGIQAIKDQLCNDKIDAKNEKIADLERQLTMANLAASQNAKIGTIQSGQRALANEIEQFVNPTPIPAYIVQNPSCCNQNYSPCGCGYR